ncbi:YjgB family protein [Shimazuella kribbensis]|uniref:YjgB family protein n=1 Tax=Shimazuella kribbensis TaxID=139808 RepID=UPI00040D2726|nr:YjgB family protein [Shimazuella kribbensis]
MKFYRLICLSALLSVFLFGCDLLSSQQSNPKHPSTMTSKHIKESESSQDLPIPEKITKPINQEHQKYLLQTLALAGSGKVIGSNFVANKNTLTDVKKEYGEPSAKSKDFPYYIYGKKRLDFGIGKDDLIYDIRSHDPKLMKITRSEVVKILGVPHNIKHNTGESIYIYHVNGFQLKLIYVLDKDDPTIHHSSVYSEAAFKKQEDQKKNEEQKKKDEKKK